MGKKRRNTASRRKSYCEYSKAGANRKPVGLVRPVGLDYPPERPTRPTCPSWPALLRCNHEVITAILLPAGLVVIGADRLLLALSDHGDPVAPAAKAHQILLHRIGAPGTDPDDRPCPATPSG